VWGECCGKVGGAGYIGELAKPTLGAQGGGFVRCRVSRAEGTFDENDKSPWGVLNGTLGSNSKFVGQDPMASKLFSN
jgi:hypothetical protein